MPWRKHPRFGNHYELRLRKHGQIKCIDFKSKVDADAYYKQIQAQKQQARRDLQQELQRENNYIRYLAVIERIAEEVNIFRGFIKREGVWNKVKSLSAPLTSEEADHIKKTRRNAGHFRLPVNFPHAPIETTDVRYQNAPQEKVKTFFPNKNIDSNIAHTTMQDLNENPSSTTSDSLTSLISKPCALSSDLSPDLSPEPSALRSDLAALKTLNDLSDCGYLSDEQNEQANDILRCHPDLWREFAQLHDWTRNEALNILSAKTVQAKCIALGIEDTRQNLRSPEDSPIERIIQECIVTNHVENEHTGFKLYNLPEAQEGEPISRHRMMMRERAYNRFIKSAMLLMRVRTAQLDYALKLRKNRPNYYDRDDYLRVSQDVINRREDEVIIQTHLNNAARWDKEKDLLHQQEEEIYEAKQRAKIIDNYERAMPGSIEAGIREYIKTHDIDQAGLKTLAKAQVLMDQLNETQAPAPISHPIIEYLKTQELDEEGSALLVQHLIDKKNGVQGSPESPGRATGLGSPGSGPETGSPGRGTKFPGPGFDPGSPGRATEFTGPDEVDQVFAASPAEGDTSLAREVSEHDPSKDKRKSHVNLVSRLSEANRSTPDENQQSSSIPSGRAKEASRASSASSASSTSHASVVSRRDVYPENRGEAPPHRDHSSAPKGRPKLAQSAGLGQSPPSQCGLKVRANTSALHARNVHLTNLRMTQKRADSLATAADRTTVVHDEPMPPELFEAKIQAARMRNRREGSRLQASARKR